MGVEERKEQRSGGMDGKKWKRKKGKWRNVNGWIGEVEVEERKVE